MYHVHILLSQDAHAKNVALSRQYSLCTALVQPIPNATLNNTIFLMPF